MRYIGKKEPSANSKGNLGDIWEMSPNGLYYCVNKPKNFMLTQEQIDSDHGKGYLEEIKETNESN